MRKLMLALVVLFLSVTVMVADSVVYECTADDVVSGQIHYDPYPWTELGDTTYIKLTEELSEPIEVCLYISGGRTLMKHPDSENIELNRNSDDGSNTITILDSGYVEGIDLILNTDEGGCSVWGADKFAVKSCNFGETALAIGAGIGARSVVVAGGCCFSDGKPVNLENVQEFIFLDNYVLSLAGKVELDGVSKIFIRGNRFTVGVSLIPVWIETADSIDIAKNLFHGHPEAIEAIRIFGNGHSKIRNNTIISFNNGVYLGTGNVLEGEVYNNIFHNVHCGVCSHTEFFEPDFLGYNHFYDIGGDWFWNVTGAPGINNSEGYTLFNTEFGLQPDSPCRDSGNDGTDKGWTGGNPNWWDRSYAMSVPDSSAEVRVEHSLTAGPNPFNAATTIYFDDSAKEIIITDLNGRVIESSAVNTDNYNWTATRNIRSGIYLVTVRFEDGAVATGRLSLVR